jgi:hypothetical protein
MQSALQRRPKHKFSADEDNVIRSMVAAHGPREWHYSAERLPGRWMNYLSPDVNTVPWTTC